MAITKWRGIMVRTSLRGSELVAGGGDGGGYGAGDELLVVGSGELGGIRALGRDFDGDGGSGDVVQRTKRGG